MAQIFRQTWLCKAHGVFESDVKDPKCPHGCRVKPEIHYTKAPGMRSHGTRNYDEIFKDIAASQNATDMKTVDGVTRFNRKTGRPEGVMRDERGQILSTGQTYGFEVPKKDKELADGRRVKTFNPSEIGANGGNSLPRFNKPNANLGKWLAAKPMPSDLEPPS